METTSIATKAKLTSAELGNLWVSFMEDSMAICVLQYFLQKVEDEEVRPHIEDALQLSQDHIQKISMMFEQENVPIPHGFTKEDVDINAPRLYSDIFFLIYLYKAAKQGMEGYSTFLSTSVRRDVVDYYSKCLSSFNLLHNQVLDTLLSKGVLVRPPYIPIPEKVDYVHKQSFLTGWFGQRRPLNSIEIGKLFYNIQRNMLGRGLILGFAQVAGSKDVRDFMMRGKEIADKHIEVFSSILSENDIAAPMIWDGAPTTSTKSPFSDKLMMFHITTIISMSVVHYGMGIGTSSRHDLGVHYTRLIAEIVQYLEDGANIMIENKWMEQPPLAPNRDELASNR
ncbi:DUF3231 family protein [Alkalihalobacillus sp. BA299]|uniref:DUF3231 family protein n=1 Tax=Alkalihalobacillus sp. BA299 TaxID=2815938 RepID=UPI001ADAD7DB|nr:DUF3231 family protein [Alkalihalobacillus sp. BA299]